MQICVGIWAYCSALVTPPFLFGWSSYQPEGLLLSCSWDYSSRDLSNRLYFIYLLAFGFAVPVGVFLYCYRVIFKFVARSFRDITRSTPNIENTRVNIGNNTLTMEQHRKRTEFHTAVRLFCNALFCLLPWIPYAVVTFIGQFGPMDDDGQLQWISPFYVTISAFFGKTSILFSPLVYGLFDQEFRTSVRHMVRG